MAPMMMKLKLAAVAFGVAQAATKICAEDGAFDGKKHIKSGDDTTVCAMMEMVLPAFTASKESCAGDIAMGDKKENAGAVFAMLAGCCTTGADVCAAYGPNPCATESDYKPSHKFTKDGQEMTCAMWSRFAGSFTPSATTCMKEVKVGDDTNLKAAMITSMAAMNGCCGTGKSNCEQFLVTPCADKTKFLPNAALDGASGISCQAAMGDVVPFTPTAATCAETVTIGGNSGTRTKHMAQAAPFCCSDKVSVCANPGSGTSTGSSSGTSTGSSSDTSVSSGSVGACVANIFFAIVALVPHMLA